MKILFFLVFLISFSFASSLRIVTYNLLNFSDENDREDDFRSIIEYIEPDIIIAQEVVGQTGFTKFKSDVLDIIEPNSWVGAPFINQSAQQDIALFYKDEYFFEGHFPDNPIVPGVVIVEAMAQTAGVVVSETLSNNKDQSVLFMSISKAKFRKPVLPNDKVSFEVKIQNKVRDVYKFSGTCLKNNVKVSESEFSAMITYK